MCIATATAHIVKSNLGETEVVGQIIMLNSIIRKLQSASPAICTYEIHPLIHPHENQMDIRHVPSWTFRPEFLRISTDHNRRPTGLSPAATLERAAMYSNQRAEPNGVPSALGTG